ncbi:hypothetical protein ACNR90_000053, partial (mitochondrion) [Candidozyma auris]
CAFIDDKAISTPPIIIATIEDIIPYPKYNIAISLCDGVNKDYFFKKRSIYLSITPAIDKILADKPINSNIATPHLFHPKFIKVLLIYQKKELIEAYKK